MTAINTIVIPQIKTEDEALTIYNEIERRITAAGLQNILGDNRWYEYLRYNLLHLEFLTTIISRIEMGKPFSFEKAFKAGQFRNSSIQCTMKAGFIRQDKDEEVFTHLHNSLYQREVLHTYYCRVRPETFGLMRAYVMYRVNKDMTRLKDDC